MEEPKVRDKLYVIPVVDSSNPHYIPEGEYSVMSQHSGEDSGYTLLRYRNEILNNLQTRNLLKASYRDECIYYIRYSSGKTDVPGTKLPTRGNRTKIQQVVAKIFPSQEAFFKKLEKTRKASHLSSYPWNTVEEPLMDQIINLLPIPFVR